MDNNVLEAVVAKSAQIKVEFVEKDEKDMGLRNILNFGHTVGHAVESVSNFQVSHGQGVSIGMTAAAKIAVKTGTDGYGKCDQAGKIIAKSRINDQIAADGSKTGNAGDAI